jgi:hypothetical protein
VCTPEQTSVSTTESPAPSSTTAARSGGGQPPPSTTAAASTPAPRPKGSGYPYYAGDYCDEFVRAWQDHYQDRAADLSSAQIAATVFKLISPVHYLNEWGPIGAGAMCTILDPDHGNSQIIQIFVTKPTGQPGAITSVKI